MQWLGCYSPLNPVSILYDRHLSKLKIKIFCNFFLQKSATTLYYHFIYYFIYLLGGGDSFCFVFAHVTLVGVSLDIIFIRII